MKTLIAICFIWSVVGAAHSEDVRVYQHGIDFVKVAPDSYVAIWASSGSPPSGEDENGEWSHDVYFSHIDPRNPALRPKRLIKAPLAQEPASSAVTKNGNILVTVEDAWRAENELWQSYAVFDRNMRPVKPYQSIVQDGGHSGHVAATDNRFVVFYSEGWVDGGGVDDLGSGDDVWLKSFDAQGNPEHSQPVAVGDKTRDWWPITAGSTDRVMLLWQRFVDGQNYSRLLMRIYDPGRNIWITKEHLLAEKMTYYAYDVQYIDELKSFLVVGTDRRNDGFALLVSTQGRILAKVVQLPAFVRESQPAMKADRNGHVRVVYPAGKNELTVLEVGPAQIRFVQSIPVTAHWSVAGSDGIFTQNGGLYFLALSPEGVVSVKVPSEALKE